MFMYGMSEPWPRWARQTLVFICHSICPGHLCTPFEEMLTWYLSARPVQPPCNHIANALYSHSSSCNQMLCESHGFGGSRRPNKWSNSKQPQPGSQHVTWNFHFHPYIHKIIIYQLWVQLFKMKWQLVTEGQWERERQSTTTAANKQQQKRNVCIYLFLKS